jgi:D-alanyl-D-alanine carboxypeptidase (penicillin-binding protein 5/6)
MRRSGVRLAALLAVGAIALIANVVTAATPATATATRTPSQAPPLPKAYVLVDVDTGAVLAQQDSRSLRPPASTIKLLTALIASQRLTAADMVPISPLAEGMPARKINVKAGQSWKYDDLMHSMLMVSANDAAVALAEKVGGGTLDGYVHIADATALRLGLADHPILNEQSGLDDQFANKGGDRISARDLAIVARAVMQRPDLMAIINTRDYSFTGGDAIGHHLPNHNLFLDLYPGANGLKTGTTDLAGHTFVGSATRNGRTMLAVVFDAVDSYASAGALLDQGFATPVANEASLDRLPEVVPDASLPPPTTAPPQTVPIVPAPVKTNSFVDSTAFALLIFIVGLLPLAALRRRVIATRNRTYERNYEDDFEVLEGY